MGLVGCPETSVRNYHYLLRNNPEECSSYLHTLLCSQKPTIYPSPELDESSLFPPCSFHIHFNIILPSVPRLSKLFPVLSHFPTKTLSVFLVSPICSAHIILSSCTFTTPASHHQSLSTTYDSMGKQCGVRYIML